ncbi:MAG TPA: hypothetical protein VGL56_16620 [Fimbriimonadaceae bacterium]|jgi:hypothetical protein
MFALLAQAPKTFEDLELLQIRDTLSLKSFYLETSFKFSVNDKNQTEDSRVKSDGKRFRQTLKLNGSPYLDVIEDANGKWVINYQNKIYFHESWTAASRAKDLKALLPEREPPGMMNISLGFPVIVQITADPPPTIQGTSLEMEGTKMYHKVIINATNSNGDLETITEWFSLDRWVLHRATITGPTVSGDISNPVTEFFERTTNKDFVVDPKSIKDFAQVDSIPQVLAHG